MYLVYSVVKAQRLSSFRQLRICSRLSREMGVAIEMPTSACQQAQPTATNHMASTSSRLREIYRTFQRRSVEDVSSKLKDVAAAEAVFHELDQQNGANVSPGFAMILCSMFTQLRDLDRALHYYNLATSIASKSQNEKAPFVYLLKHMCELAALMVEAGAAKDAKRLIKFSAPVPHLLRYPATVLPKPSITRLFETALACGDDAALFAHIFSISYHISQSVLLDCLLRAYIRKGHASAAVSTFLQLADGHRKTPCQFPLFCLLIESGDDASLHKVVEKVVSIHGYPGTNFTLSMAYLNANKIDKGISLLMAPGSCHYSENGLAYWWREFADRQRIDVLKALIHLTDGQTDQRTLLYHFIIRACCNANDWWSGSVAWSNMVADGLIASAETKNLLAELLLRNDKQVPFHIPKSFDWTKLQSKALEHPPFQLGHNIAARTTEDYAVAGRQSEPSSSSTALSSEQVSPPNVNLNRLSFFVSTLEPNSFETVLRALEDEPRLSDGSLKLLRQIVHDQKYVSRVHDLVDKAVVADDFHVAFEIWAEHMCTCNYLHADNLLKKYPGIAGYLADDTCLEEFLEYAKSLKNEDCLKRCIAFMARQNSSANRLAQSLIKVYMAIMEIQAGNHDFDGVVSSFQMAHDDYHIPPDSFPSDFIAKLRSAANAAGLELSFSGDQTRLLEESRQSSPFAASPLIVNRPSKYSGRPYPVANDHRLPSDHFSAVDSFQSSSSNYDSPNLQGSSNFHAPLLPQNNVAPSRQLRPRKPKQPATYLPYNGRRKAQLNDALTTRNAAEALSIVKQSMHQIPEAEIRKTLDLLLECDCELEAVRLLAFLFKNVADAKHVDAKIVSKLLRSVAVAADESMPFLFDAILRRIDETNLDEYTALLSCFIRSPAYANKVVDFVATNANTIPSLPLIVWREFMTVGQFERASSLLDRYEAIKHVLVGKKTRSFCQYVKKYGTNDEIKVECYRQCLPIFASAPFLQGRIYSYIVGVHMDSDDLKAAIVVAQEAFSAGLSPEHLRRAVLFKLHLKATAAGLEFNPALSR